MYYTVPGDVVPADGLLIKSSELRVDESSHTGESKDVKKAVDTDPTLYAGQSDQLRRSFH